MRYHLMVLIKKIMEKKRKKKEKVYKMEKEFARIKRVKKNNILRIIKSFIM